MGVTASPIPARDRPKDDEDRDCHEDAKARGQSVQRSVGIVDRELHRIHRLLHRHPLFPFLCRTTPSIPRPRPPCRKPTADPVSVAPVGNPAIVVHTGRVPGPRLSSGKEADLHPVTLVFTDPELEAAFRADFARRNLINLRVAHVMGLVLWPLWGLLIHRYLTGYRGVDLAVRYGVL